MTSTKTISIELLNEDTLALLHHLEHLHLLKVITNEPQEKNIKRKWAGSISKEAGEQMLEKHKIDRQSWERDI